MTALDAGIKDVGGIRTRHLFYIVVDLEPRLAIGGPLGERVLSVAPGGSFSAPDPGGVGVGAGAGSRRR